MEPKDIAQTEPRAEDDPQAALYACPICDTLYTEPEVPDASVALCRRCGHVIAAPRSDSFARVLALAMTSAILMTAAIFFPFIDLQAGGIHNRTSILDAIQVFSSGLMVPLAVVVALLIVLIPTLRLLAIIYTLLPLMRGHRPFAHAKAAFRLAERLRPWSMAEIFIVGVAVALVKVGGLATLNLGPAFWAMSGFVVVTVLQDTSMCRDTIWNALEARGR
ncbi:paraquat-inducible protein A [Marinovum sp.]|uniref:paraquat-inducible protein A n=1 Tax=Marinovum sp. TaxID=2024839 RepID=UPI002B27A4C5|nr:paraquat-inducible protein A [Marinovum sp.]